MHAHLTRLPAMNARLSAAIDSSEASMRTPVREATDSALAAIHKAMNHALAKIRCELAWLSASMEILIQPRYVPRKLNQSR